MVQSEVIVAVKELVVTGAMEKKSMIHSVGS